MSKKERKQKPRGYWDIKENCKELLSTKEGKNIYSIIYTRNIQSECYSHFINIIKNRHPNGYWNLERCIEYTKNIKTPKELYLKEKGSSCYGSIKTNKWFEFCFKS